jgi:hypothetical protein
MVPMPNSYMLYEIIEPEKSGELFLYVNDAIIAVPGLYNLFYKNNAGTTSVAITRR